jgi:hypothetical protein
MKAATKTARVPAKKVVKAAAPVVAEFRVWCERCSIRIAPNEERIAVRKLIYHANCYSKLSIAAKAKDASGGQLPTA